MGSGGEGLFPALLRANREKKDADLHKEVLKWGAVLDNPYADDTSQQVALDNIAKLYGPELGVPKAQHGFLGNLIGAIHGHLSSLNPAPGNKWEKPGVLKQLPGNAPAIPGQDDGMGLGTKTPDMPAYHPFNERAPIRRQEEADQAARAKGIGDEQAQFQQQQTEALATLKAAGVDPKSAEGQNFLLNIRQPTSRTGGADVSDEVANLRKKRADDLELTGDARTEFLLTGKLPTSFGKPAPPAKPQTTSGLAFEAYAQKNNKPVESLTALERVTAIRDYNKQTKVATSGAGGAGKAEDRSVGRAVGEAIMNGEQPPEMTGLTRQEVGEARAAMAKKGFNLVEATLDWNAMKRWVSVQNGDRQQRLQQAASFANDSLDVITDLSKKVSDLLPRSQFPLFNKAVLAVALNGGAGPEAAKAANNLNAQIQDLQSELATVYKGGNSPTDVGLKQAMEMLNSDWDEDRLQSAIDLAKKNLTIRLNSLRNIGVSGMSPNSVYAKQAADIGGAPAGGNGGAAAPTKLPAGAKAPKTAAEFDQMFSGKK